MTCPWGEGFGDDVTTPTRIHSIQWPGHSAHCHARMPRLLPGCFSRLGDQPEYSRTAVLRSQAGTDPEPRIFFTPSRQDPEPRTFFTSSNRRVRLHDDPNTDPNTRVGAHARAPDPLCWEHNLRVAKPSEPDRRRPASTRNRRADRVPNKRGQSGWSLFPNDECSQD
jgi:hypothetical protein